MNNDSNKRQVDLWFRYLDISNSLPHPDHLKYLEEYMSGYRGEMVLYTGSKQSGRAWRRIELGSGYIETSDGIQTLVGKGWAALVVAMNDIAPITEWKAADLKLWNKMVTDMLYDPPMTLEEFMELDEAGFFDDEFDDEEWEE